MIIAKSFGSEWGSSHSQTAGMLIQPPFTALVLFPDDFGDEAQLRGAAPGLVQEFLKSRRDPFKKCCFLGHISLLGALAGPSVGKPAPAVTAASPAVAAGVI